MSSYQTWDTTLPEALGKFPEVQKKLVLSETSGMNKIIECFNRQQPCPYHGSYEYENDRFVYPENIRVRLILDDGVPIAWGWLIPYQQRLNRKYRRRLAFMVFVHWKFRRNGIGLSLYQWAKEISDSNRRPMVVFPWNEVSDSFYDNKCRVLMKYQNDWFSF